MQIISVGAFGGALWQAEGDRVEVAQETEDSEADGAEDKDVEKTLVAVVAVAAVVEVTTVAENEAEGNNVKERGAATEGEWPRASDSITEDAKNAQV